MAEPDSRLIYSPEISKNAQPAELMRARFFRFDARARRFLADSTLRIDESVPLLRRAR